MKTVSIKDLEGLVKEKGWELASDSKKSLDVNKVISVLSKSAEGVALLTQAVTKVEKAVAENDNQVMLARALAGIENAMRSVQTVDVVNSNAGKKTWKFEVKRGKGGLITEVVAKEG